jgi:hypothetical protein
MGVFALRITRIIAITAKNVAWSVAAAPEVTLTFAAIASNVCHGNQQTANKQLHICFCFLVRQGL